MNFSKWHLQFLFFYFSFTVARMELLSIMDTLKSRIDLQRMGRFLSFYNVSRVLSADHQWTLFATNNLGFSNIPYDVMINLITDYGEQTFKKILLSHVIKGYFNASMINKMVLPSDFITMNGPAVISKKKSKLLIDTATIITFDIEAKDGIIHIIDQLLLIQYKTVDLLVIFARFQLLSNIIFLIKSETIFPVNQSFVFFAPTDGAFLKLFDDITERLRNPAYLSVSKRILLNHIYIDENDSMLIKAAKLPDRITMVGGENLTVTKYGSDIQVQGVTIILPDLETLDGLIHVIETLILPPFDIFESLVMNESLERLARLIVQLNLTEMFSRPNQLTIFAPTDKAFKKLQKNPILLLLDDVTMNETVVEQILFYHIVRGDLSLNKTDKINVSLTTINHHNVIFSQNQEKMTIDDVPIVGKGIRTVNGMIYMIDEFLRQTLNSLQNLATHGCCQTFILAVEQAEILTLIESQTSTTLFVPSDQAFDKLTKRAILDLISGKDKNQLNRFLQHYIINRKIFLGDVTSMDLPINLLMPFNNTMTITTKGNKLYVNQATITLMDIPLRNGYIHVIDTVLFPLPSINNQQSSALSLTLSSSLIYILLIIQSL